MSTVKSKVYSDVAEVSKFARLVVAKRVAIVAAITIIVNLAVSNGWITPDLSDHALSVTTSILDGIAGLLAIAVIHPAVTPVKDPRDSDGNPLVAVTVKNISTDAHVKEDEFAEEEASAQDSVENLPDPEPDPAAVVDPTTSAAEANSMNTPPVDSSPSPTTVVTPPAVV